MNRTDKTSLSTFLKVFVQIESKNDEKKWKNFLGHFFPNHYASKLLDSDLVIEREARHSGHAYTNKSIAVSPKGYGYITFRFAYLGGYQEVNNFDEFKLTACYKAIVAQGVVLDTGRPEIIEMKRL